MTAQQAAPIGATSPHVSESHKPASDTDEQIDSDVAPEGPITTATPSGGHAVARRRQVASNFFWTWSLKAGGVLVGLESELEFRAWHYLSAQSAVVHMKEQPVRIPHLFSSGHRYTFDIGVRRRDGSECLYEVKPESRLELMADGTLAPKHWNEISGWCRASGRNCAFVTDTDLEAHRQLIDNWILMMPYVREAHEYPEPVVQAELVQLAARPEGITLADAAANIDSHTYQTVIAQALWLVHEGELAADLDREALDADLVLYTGGSDE